MSLDCSWNFVYTLRFSYLPITARCTPEGGWVYAGLRFTTLVAKPGGDSIWFRLANIWIWFVWLVVLIFCGTILSPKSSHHQHADLAKRNRLVSMNAAVGVSLCFFFCIQRIGLRRVTASNVPMRERLLISHQSLRWECPQIIALSTVNHRDMTPTALFGSTARWPLFSNALSWYLVI